MEAGREFGGMCCSTGGIEDVSAFPVKRWLPTAWCRLAGGFRGAGKARFVVLYWIEASDTFDSHLQYKLFIS